MENDSRTSEETVDEEMALSAARGHIHGFFALIYAREPDEELSRRIGEPAFAEMTRLFGLDPGVDFHRLSREENLPDLALEFNRLFLGPGRHISPFESVHEEGRLFGSAAVEVKKMIESVGLKLSSNQGLHPDHISVEFEFMQKLLMRKHRHLKENEPRRAAWCRSLEKKFIAERLAPWAPSFCDQVVQETTRAFYREMAKMTKTFIAFEIDASKQ